MSADAVGTDAAGLGAAGSSAAGTSAAGSGAAGSEPLGAGRSGGAAVNLMPERDAGAAMAGPQPLSVRVALTRGAFALDVALTVAPGEALALVGPNGAGKSTLLEVVAGLLRPHEGEVSLGGRKLTDVSAGRGEVVEVPRRRIGLLAQEPRLFPHLDARENVAFGPLAQRWRRADALDAAGEWLDRVGLGGFTRRKPHELSGGQQQRVAIARAFAAEPQALLLDEPFTSLDVATANEIRALVGAQLRRVGIPAVIVSHEIIDALALADRVAVLADGRVVESGPVDQVIGEPRHPFTAALAGLCFVSGRFADGAVRLADGTRIEGSIAHGDSGVTREPSRGAEVAAVFAPRNVSVSARAPGAVANAWRATVTSVERTAYGLRVHASAPPIAAELSVAEAAALSPVLREGDALWFGLSPSHVSIRALE